MGELVEFFQFWTYALDLFYGILGNMAQFFSWVPSSAVTLLVAGINIALVWRFLGWGD